MMKTNDMLVLPPAKFCMERFRDLCGQKLSREQRKKLLTAKNAEVCAKNAKKYWCRVIRLSCGNFVRSVAGTYSPAALAAASRASSRTACMSPPLASLAVCDGFSRVSFRRAWAAVLMFTVSAGLVGGVVAGVAI